MGERKRKRSPGDRDFDGRGKKEENTEKQSDKINQVKKFFNQNQSDFLDF